MRYLYFAILIFIAVIASLAFLKVGRSMNTLAEDKSFMESMRIMDKATPKPFMEAPNE